MIVVDASVLADALVGDGEVGDRARLALAPDPRWCAPEHLLVEVFSAIRGLVLGGEVTDGRARQALVALGEAAIDIIGTAPLLDRMWQLRANVSGYDAAYVAVAEALQCPLITADGRLANTPGIRCEIRLVAP